MRIYERHQLEPHPHADRARVAHPRFSCVVCGLRADCLVCKECALTTEASIKWLERLPASERVTKGLEVLRGMG